MTPSNSSHNLLCKINNYFFTKIKRQSHLEHTLQDASSCHTSFQVIHFTAGLVHVERSDDWNTENVYRVSFKNGQNKTVSDKRKEATRVRFLSFLPMSLGSEMKSLMGTGIFLTMYSQTTSMLYFSCAEMGMMGAPSATVPAGETWRTTSGQTFRERRRRPEEFEAEKM